jgi:hypothetical protein
MSQPKFAVGQRVIRINENLGAVVIVVQNTGNLEIFYCIKYDEGGSGWWPEDSLKPETI